MSKLIATLVATLFAATAFAQTNATPPVQPATGTTASTTLKKPDGTPVGADKPMTDKKAARAAKSKARKLKRDEKVGDKPLN